MTSSWSQYGCRVESMSMPIRATLVPYALMARVPIAAIKFAERPAAPWAGRNAGDDYGVPAEPDWRSVDWSPHGHSLEVDGRPVNYVDYGEARDDARPIVL